MLEWQLQHQCRLALCSYCQACLSCCQNEVMTYQMHLQCSNASLSWCITHHHFTLCPAVMLDIVPCQIVAVKCLQFAALHFAE